MGNLKFNGKSTEELGLVIQTPPSYTFPEKDMSSIHIPGRNGDLYIDNKCYKNVERVYSLAKGFRPGTKMYPNAQEILSWLSSANGQYVRLEDSYDDEVYRMAMFNMGSSFINYFDEATSIDVTFQCKPQRFLKSGEKELTFKGSNNIIENPTVYDAKPLIKIEDIPTIEEETLMLIIKDYTNEPVSNLTLKDLTDVVIDSENQTIEDLTGKNVAYNVGLNGMIFPEFKKSKSKIEISKFIRKDSGAIDSYEKVMSDYRKQCDCLYMPIEMVETEKQTKALIKPWEQVISNRQEGMYAESYLSFISSKSENFTVLGPSSVLDESGYTTGLISGDLKDYAGAVHNTTGEAYWALQFKDSSNDEYLRIVQYDNNPDYLFVFIRKAGYFLDKRNDSWKNIKHYMADISVYVLSQKKSSIIEIEYYPENDNHKLIIPYNDTGMPNWLYYEVICDSEIDHNRSVTQVNIKAAKAGYFLLPPTGILIKKSNWQSKNQNDIICSFKWNTSKKRFVGNDSAILEKEKDYELKYLESIIDYEADIDRKEVKHFTITGWNPSSDVHTITINTIESGYYKILIDGSTTGTWQYKGSETSLANIDDAKSFSVFYIPIKEGDLNNFPDVSFSQLKDWPSWLYDLPVKSDGSSYSASDILNPSDKTICFRVLESKYYKYYDPEEEHWIDIPWSENPIQINGILTTNISKDNSLYICKIDTPPVKWLNDRVYITYEEDPDTHEVIKVESDTPPEWLHVEIDDTPPDPDNEDSKEIHYSSSQGVAGYFKWDTNSVWIKKDGTEGLVDRALLNTKIKDDSIFYYMDDLPDYTVDNIPHPEFFDLVEFAPQELNGNPSEVKITTKVSGYYRINNNANWKYYSENEELAISKIGEENIIYYLEPNNDGLNNIKITIIPRWWML